jgi:predicted amidohydrolase
MADFVLAAIQAAPVHFDREASTEKACRLIAQAGAKGATLAAFSETWLPGYPTFAFAPPTPVRWRAGAAYIAAALEIPGPEVARLCAAARKAKIDVAIGVAEIDPRTRSTVYCTLLFISRDGEILGKHRKLKPTFHERTAFGEGDGSGLRVYERPYGRISGLNCWEHQMMLPGYALAMQGTQIHVAAWPGREPDPVPAPPTALWPRQTLLSLAFASQAGAYVIAVSAINRKADFPAEFREAILFEHDGGSCIIDPRGEIIAGPVKGEETILIAEGSLDLVRAVKSVVDIAGHYSRPDVFNLRINRAGADDGDAATEVRSNSRVQSDALKAARA